MQFPVLSLILSGARPVLPMGVAPEALVGCMHRITGSKNFVELLLFLASLQNLRVIDVIDDEHLL